jgi:hypothetical protein
MATGGSLLKPPSSIPALTKRKFEKEEVIAFHLHAVFIFLFLIILE